MGMAKVRHRRRRRLLAHVEAARQLHMAALFRELNRLVGA